MEALTTGFCFGFGFFTVIALPYLFRWGGCEF
jgi:hypothetical protein